MITYIRKGKERKELMISKLEYHGSPLEDTYQIIIFASDRKGNIQLTGEQEQTVKGKKEAYLTYYRALKKFKADGWEVECMR